MALETEEAIKQYINAFSNKQEFTLFNDIDISGMAAILDYVCAELIDVCGTNIHGSLTRSSLAKCLINDPELAHSLYTIFNVLVYDIDKTLSEEIFNFFAKDQCILKDEFKRMLRGLSITEWNQQQIDELYHEIARDNNHYISLSDFVSFCTQNIDQTTNGDAKIFITKIKEDDEDVYDGYHMLWQVKCIKNNIIKHIEPPKQSLKSHKNVFNSNKLNIYDANDNNNNISVILHEIGLFGIIFNFLAYHDIINGVYKVCRLFHASSIPILNRKYVDQIKIEWIEGLQSPIKNIGYQVYISKTLGQEFAILISGLLLYLMNRLMDTWHLKDIELILKKLLGDNSLISNALIQYKEHVHARIGDD